MHTADHVATLDVRCYAEIGINEGNTVIRVAKRLKPGSTVYLFDIGYWVEKVAKRLIVECPGIKIVKCANEAKIKSSYCWTLMKLLEAHPLHRFDCVYLDGAHTWYEDALAFFLVDRLLNVNATIEFDDYSWTIDKSPTLSPAINPLMNLYYTDEELRPPHIQKVVDLLVKRDPRYIEIERNRVYRKIKDRSIA